MLEDGKYSFVTVWMCTDLAVVVVVTAHAMHVFVMRLPPLPPTVLLLMVTDRGQYLSSSSRVVRRGVDCVVGQDEEERVPSRRQPGLRSAVTYPLPPFL